MAVRKPAPEPEPVAAPADDSAVIMALIRMMSRLAVAQTVDRTLGVPQGAATFRQIAVHELHIASDRDVDAIEAWLAAHPGG